jgi:type IV pilus assembly protein PilB
MASQIEIVELLRKEGLITEEQLAKAYDETKRTGLSIEKALQKLGFISESDIASARAASLGVPYIDLSDYIIDAELVKLIPENIAKKFRVVPLFKIGHSLTVAMANPQDIMALDQVRKVSQIDIIDPVLATEDGIQKILDSYYGVSGSVDGIVKFIEAGKILEEGSKDAAEVAEEAPIIKLVNLVVMEAVKQHASDIHVEPEDEMMRIRYRVDGLLREAHTIPKKLQSAVISRIKILSKMDISENRKPKDGRIRLKLEGRDLDIRVSTFPTIHGENVVMRLLDRASIVFGLRDLGFSGTSLDDFEKLIRHPYGIILVTGPTGSGKTTTLYSALTSISSMEKNIITIEDPVEYELPLIRQTPVNQKAGISFANGLRHILRQDPDIIMVGEIRDKETAEVAIQAALTGHLVFSTLHTNDAPSALTRLIDMGIEPFLISSSVIGILAQRLVRTICPKCKEKYAPSKETLSDIGDKSISELYKGKGCASCGMTGFSGRIGIFELLVLDEEMRNMVNGKKSADDLKRKALEKGMRVLKDDGLEKVKAGVTTPDEVFRVTEV